MFDTGPCVNVGHKTDQFGSLGRVFQQSGIPFLSVIAPCFNEEKSLPTFHERVRTVCESIGKTYEIILVNDGSHDRSWVVMNQLAEANPSVIAVNLARNVGQEKALAAGLKISRGDFVLILDADLQDPPELLPRMLELAEEGADVVYGQRRSRSGDSLFKIWTASVFYRVMDMLSEIPIPRDTGFFRLLRRRVVEVLLQMPEQRRYHRGMVSWAGFRQVPLPFDREARQAGESHWPLRRMISLALDAITGYSTRPLQWSGWFAGACACIAFFTLSAGLWSWISQGLPNQAYLIISAISGIASLQLLALFILGEYIGRISEQVRGRPLYVIESVISSRNLKCVERS